MPPTAAAVAILEPEIAAKKAQVAMATILRPPVTCPINELHKLISLRDTPPADIKFPANTKKGIASKEKDAVPEYIRCAQIERFRSLPSKMAARPEAPSENATGTPIISKKVNAMNRTAVMISAPPRFRT